MQNIRDLHFRKDIIPLFDSVCNEFSRDTLIQLLSDPLPSIEKIMARQNILKGLIEQEHLFFPFFYSPSEFNEVYAYTEELRARGFLLNGSFLPFIFSRKKWEREKGRLGHFFIFLRKIEQAYFARLKAHLFPNDIKEDLEDLVTMLSDLDIAKNEAIIRKRGFTRTEVSRLAGKLNEKIRTGKLDRFWKAFFLFEAYHSIASNIIKHKFNFPEFNKEGISITDLYHPLLKHPVKNSITTEKNVTLITGPNMSGKSTLLKTIGLCIYLAHLGLAVPAGACELVFFDEISIAIDLNDDLRNGYSHFMSEIKNLKAVITAASNSKRCFAIFDELFSRTNAEDALVISQKTIEGLTQYQGSYFFISTHLHQLKDTIVGNERISPYYIECRLEDNTPVFTYKLQKGWSDLKIGQLIFEQEGLNRMLLPSAIN